MTVKLVEKGSHVQISKNVNLDEFECQCTFKACVAVIINSELFDKFEILRERCGNQPLRITSGYRCPSHNNSVPKSAKLSRHMAGTALDIAYPFHVSNEEFEKHCKDLFEFNKIYMSWIHVNI